MLDAILDHACDPAAESDLRRRFTAHLATLTASLGRADTTQVARAEAEVRQDPTAAFAFDPDGTATLTALGRTWQAGRFETPSIALLRERARAAHPPASSPPRLRLFVLDGEVPATDIGGLQATAPPGALFQVASQFNCLESPGPSVTSVASYLNDSTQGPRASISAFPATLLRHYSAPAPEGSRFVQVNDGRQLELLGDLCKLGLAQVQNGYLTASHIADPVAFAAQLEARLDAIRVGVHDGAQVVLGHKWSGSVVGSDDRRVAQVFTSTIAGGGYGGKAIEPTVFSSLCRPLLRAAYLGTLLAAATLGRTPVVLTLIGGGVFGNPLPLIWQSIQWALGEVAPLLSRELDVVVNGRDLGTRVPRAELLAAARDRGGALVVFGGNDFRTGLRALE